jgi:hypothetical protein
MRLIKVYFKAAKKGLDLWLTFIIFVINIKMMIERVRLQRKFNMKSDVDVGQRVAQITRMMILFELSVILVVCLLNLSLHFHLNHV